MPKETAKRSNVTAFQLNDTVEAPPDGMSLPPLPGLWKNGEPVSVEALGLTVTELRELLAELSLPIEEVLVPQSRALKEFPPPAGHLTSESNTGHPLVEGYVAPEADLAAAPDPTLLDRAVENVEQVAEDRDRRDEVAGQEAE